MAGGTAFLHHSDGDAASSALRAPAPIGPCKMGFEDETEGCTDHPPGMCNPSLYGIVGTTKPKVLAGKPNFATWEPSVRSTRS